MRDYLLLFFDDKNILSRSGFVRKLGSPKIVGHYQDPQAVTANGLPSVWHDRDIIRNEYFVGDMLLRKKGNGCKNSAVQEKTLLAKIVSVLETEQFVKVDFDILVERVVITPDGIQVRLRNNMNPSSVVSDRQS